jgi:hypothetical protein
MFAFITCRGGPLAGLIRLFRGPAPTSAQTARLSAYCRAIAERDGAVSDWDPLLEQFGDVAAMAERQGLVCGGSGWDLAVCLTETGRRLAAGEVDGGQLVAEAKGKAGSRSRGSLARRAARATRLRIRLRDKTPRGKIGDGKRSCGAQRG